MLIPALILSFVVILLWFAIVTYRIVQALDHTPDEHTQFLGIGGGDFFQHGERN